EEIFERLSRQSVEAARLAEGEIIEISPRAEGSAGLWTETLLAERLRLGDWDAWFEARERYESQVRTIVRRRKPFSRDIIDRLFREAYDKRHSIPVEGALRWLCDLGITLAEQRARDDVEDDV